MIKSPAALLLSLLIAGQAGANGNLHSLIIELENIRGLVELQEKRDKERLSDERWTFRYDLLHARLTEIIVDIETHIELKKTLPRTTPVELRVERRHR